MIPANFRYDHVHALASGSGLRQLSFGLDARSCFSVWIAASMSLDDQNRGRLRRLRRDGKGIVKSARPVLGS